MTDINERKQIQFKGIAIAKRSHSKKEGDQMKSMGERNK
jgi:hypothetical protein